MVLELAGNVFYGPGALRGPEVASFVSDWGGARGSAYPVREEDRRGEEGPRGSYWSVLPVACIIPEKFSNRRDFPGRCAACGMR